MHRNETERDNKPLTLEASGALLEVEEDVNGTCLGEELEKCRRASQAGQEVFHFSERLAKQPPSRTILADKPRVADQMGPLVSPGNCFRNTGAQADNNCPVELPVSKAGDTCRRPRGYN